MSTGEQFASKSHCTLVPSVTTLELRLTQSDESDNLNGSSPSMLNQGAILNLNVETRKSLPCFGVDVVFIYVVNATIPCRLRVLKVIVLIWFIAKLVIESGSVEF